MSQWEAPARGSFFLLESILALRICIFLPIPGLPPSEVPDCWFCYLKYNSKNGIIRPRGYGQSKWPGQGLHASLISPGCGPLTAGCWLQAAGYRPPAAPPPTPGMSQGTMSPFLRTHKHYHGAQAFIHRETLITRTQNISRKHFVRVRF